MDYEEKYNKLVEAVKVLQETNLSDEGIQNWVNDNVPELAESEDEKIRQWLIKYFNKADFNGMLEYVNGIKAEDILAWLEKQKKEENKNCWELDNWRPSGKQMSAFEVMLNSEKNHNWFCDDVRLLMQSLYDDLKLIK